MPILKLLNLRKIKDISVLFFLYLIFNRLLFASGYHPPFDEAVSEAELIVQGKVVNAWTGAIFSEPIGITIEE